MSLQKTSESLKILILKRAKPPILPLAIEDESDQAAFKSFSHYPQYSYKAKASGKCLLVLPQRK